MLPTFTAPWEETETSTCTAIRFSECGGYIEKHYVCYSDAKETYESQKAAYDDGVCLLDCYYNGDKHTYVSVAAETMPRDLIDTLFSCNIDNSYDMVNQTLEMLKDLVTTAEIHGSLGLLREYWDVLKADCVEEVVGKDVHWENIGWLHGEATGIDYDAYYNNYAPAA